MSKVDPKVIEGIKKTVLEQRASGRTFPEIEKYMKSAGVVNSRGVPYSASALNCIANDSAGYGASKAEAAKKRAQYNHAPVQRSRSRKKARRGAAQERTVNNLMRAVLDLTNVDRDAKLALIELVAGL